MKVCIVTPRYPPDIKGGGEISVSLLARGLSEYVDVEVISFDKDITNESVVDGVPVTRVHPILPHEFKFPMNLRSVLLLRKKINDCDIFHSYNHDLMPSLGVLTKRYNINSVATLNGSVYFLNLDTTGFSLNRSLFGYLRGAMLGERNKVAMHFIKEIKMFTTLSPFYKEKFAEAGLPREKIRIITNMLDPNFKPMSKTTKEKKKDKTKILYLGPFTFAKGIDILIEAYSKLEDQDIELIMGGDNPAKIIGLIKKFNPKNEINLIGKIHYNEIPRMYAEADIYVQPYRYPYPIGRTVLEAMMTGLPIITTGNNHYSPVIEHMKSGILIYPMTPERLANALQALIDSPTLRKKLSRNSQKRVKSICSPKKIIRKYIEVYESLL